MAEKQIHNEKIALVFQLVSVTDFDQLKDNLPLISRTLLQLDSEIAANDVRMNQMSNMLNRIHNLVYK